MCDTRHALDSKKTETRHVYVACMYMRAHAGATAVATTAPLQQRCGIGAAATVRGAAASWSVGVVSDVRERRKSVYERVYHVL